MSLSPLSSSTAATPPPHAPALARPRAAIAACVAGNALEFFDFVAYAFFAVYIGRAFFPAATELGRLLSAVAVFGVGFLSRPFGGVLFGVLADRLGRRPALLWTIALMTFGTLALAVTPSYERIGMAAPVIIVLARLVQGLALGGEVGPSSALLIELAPAGRRGLYGSWQSASQGLAIVAAGTTGLLLTATLAPAQMQDWGWRVPFALALLALPIAIVLRRQLPEHDEPRSRDATVSIAELVRARRTIALSVVVIIGGTVSTYVGNYMTTFAIATLKLAPVVAMGAAVVGGVAIFAFALLGGWLSDRFGRRPVMLWPRVAAAVTTLPLFLALIHQPTVAMLLVVTALLSALTGLSAAASLVVISELLPRRIRATGLSITYAIGVTLFGGSTQFVATWLIAATGDASAPAWLVAVTSVAAAAAMLALPETRHERLRD